MSRPLVCAPSLLLCEEVATAVTCCERARKNQRADSSGVNLEEISASKQQTSSESRHSQQFSWYSIFLCGTNRSPQHGSEYNAGTEPRPLHELAAKAVIILCHHSGRNTSSSRHAQTQPAGNLLAEHGCTSCTPHQPEISSRPAQI